MLATDAHGGDGGIAKYNRDVLDSLSQSDSVSEILVLPRRVAHVSFMSPAKVRYDMTSAAGLKNYLGRSAANALGRGFDLVYCAHINLLPLAAIIAGLRRTPLALAIYGIEAWQRPVSPLHRLAVRLPALVISISQITLDRFRAWSGVRAPTAVVPNAIDLGLFTTGGRNPELERRYNITKRKVIMTFGRMAADERYKGFDEIIELLPRLRRTHPDLVYLAAGDGSDRPRLEAKAREVGVEDMVAFTGSVPEAEKADLYRLADAYVMPSSGEGFGFVVLEALACGIPVVASTVDGTREAVRGGKLGLLADPRTPDVLERAILEALQRPKAIPPGLEYFSVPNFRRRLRAAISKIAAI